MIEACLPFQTKLDELEDCIKRGKKSSSNGRNRPDTPSEYPREEKGKSAGRRQTGFDFERDDDEDINARDAGRTIYEDDTPSKYYINGEVNVEMIIDEIIQENLINYRYSDYMEKEFNTYFRPDGFEAFKMDGNHIIINSEIWSLADIFRKIIKAK